MLRGCSTSSTYLLNPTPGRAAWRLESVGFSEVYDYTVGELHWLAAGLPTEGTNATRPCADGPSSQGLALEQELQRCGYRPKVPPSTDTSPRETVREAPVVGLSQLATGPYGMYGDASERLVHASRRLPPAAGAVR